MKTTFRALVLTVLSLSAACCRSELPYVWTDPDSGLLVRSDFPVATTQAVFETQLAGPMAALRALFRIDRLDGLRLYLHDQTSWRISDDVSIAGWHRRGEIHAMAGWPEGLQLAFPTVAANGTVRHEYVHALVARSEMHLPRWFEEGLCEVLSVSLPVDGELVWLPNGARERTARRLLAQDAWLTADELLAVVDGYPDDPQQLTALYAQATSFVWHLLKHDPPGDADAIAAVAGQPAERLRRLFAAWQAELAQTTIASLYEPFVDHDCAAVRDVAVDELGRPGEDEAEWRLAERLLIDPSPSVRASMRIKVICRPADSDQARRHFRRWADSEQRELRRCGELALAQLGDRAAATRLCRGFVTDEREWAQPMIWLLMIVPDRNGARRAPAVELMAGELPLHACATAVADDLEAMADRLAWNAEARRFELR